MKKDHIVRSLLWLTCIAAAMVVLLGRASITQQNIHWVSEIKESDLYLCNGQQMTAGAIAAYRGITFETMLLLRKNRSLTPDEICVIAQEKLERGISKASDSKRPDEPDKAAEWRALQLQDENSYIPPDGLVTAQAQISEMSAQVTGQAAGINSGSWTWLGPGNIGGRVRSIVIKPDDANTMWAGSVTGGIWKTTDGGASWQIMDDFMANLSVTSLVIDPHDYNTLYAGTGEGGFYTYQFDSVFRGAGVFKTTNGGVTWTQLSATNNANWYYVTRLAISPDGSTLLASAQSGIWRSINGGANWTQTLSAHEVLDIDFDPNDSSKAIASEYEYNTNSAVWYSIDGGSSWTQANFNFSVEGRIETAYAKSDSSIAYASSDSLGGEIWKSTDGGQNYSLVSSGYSYLAGQGWYANIIWVNPLDANMIIVGGLDLWRSTNGGGTLTKISDWQYVPPSAHAEFLRGVSLYLDENKRHQKSLNSGLQNRIMIVSFTEDYCALARGQYSCSARADAIRIIFDEPHKPIS